MTDERIRERILVVDDEPNILSSVKDLLEDEFKVQTCTSAEEALEILGKNNVAAILSDQRMPGMNGDEFLAKARQLSEATRILITGYADLEAVVRAVNRGQIYGYVSKPWDPFQLKTLVGRAVEHFELIKELQHEKNLLHTLMDNSADAIFIKDADRRFLRANGGMARLFELDDPAELVGKRTEDFGTVSTELLEDVRSKDEALIASGKPQLDEIVQAEQPDGTRIWFSISRAPIVAVAGRVDGIVGIVRDVSDRLRAEQDLRESEEKFHDFATTASDWFWESDEDHCFTWFSERFAEVTGFDVKEFLGKRRDQVGLENVDARNLKAHLADLKARRPFRDVTYARRRADGRQMWASTNGTPVFDENGDFRGYRGTGADVTDRKRAEEAVALVSGIALRLSEVENIDEALEVSLKRVCQRLGWDVGEAWLAGRESGRMQFRKGWSEDAALLEKFAASARDLALGPGEGLQGRVWDSREAIWVGDTASQTPEMFARRDLAVETGMKSACAIPVIASDRVVAVLEFFLRDPLDDDRSWMTALAAATAPLGAFLQRIAAEDAQRESEARFRDFADIGTDWLWETDNQDRFTWISGRMTDALGIPVESLVGKTRYESGMEGIDEKSVNEHLADQTVRRPFRDFVFARRRPDGQLVWVSVNGNPHFDDEGNFLGYRGVGTNITHRVQAEQALREREETVRLLLNSTAEAIYGIDSNGYCTFCNPATLDMLGYADERELIGQDMHALSHHTTVDGKPYPAEECPISQARCAGKPAHSADEVFWRADGTSFPVEYWCHPIFKDGERSGAVVTFLDITDRKRAEDAVRLVNRIAAAATQASDAEAAFTLTLEHTCRHLGWTLGEAWVPDDGELRLSACWHESDPALDRFESESVGHTFARGQGLPGRVWEKRTAEWLEDTAAGPSDGSPRSGVAAACGLKTACAIPVIANEAVIAVLIFLIRRGHDEDALWLEALAAAAAPLGSVLQRIVAEEQMASLARFHSENPSPVLRITADGVIHSANAAASQLLAIWGTGVGKPAAPGIRAMVRDMLESNLPQQFEVEGEEKAFSLNLVPISDENYVNVYATDVTLQKFAEQKLRQVQKMEAIGQLTGGVAHDFNNRLTVMLGNLELLEERLADNDKALRLIHGARRAAEGGAKLTRQLLTFSRRQMLDPEVVNVNSVLHELEDMVRRTLGETVKVYFKLESFGWPVHVDAGQLEDAIINLVVNARDAMPDGGTLTIETSNMDMSGEKLPTREYMLPGEYVMIAITDTGTGIPREIQDRIFEPFFTTKERGKGTGLGMAMVYGFAKQTRGYVNVYSEEGHGTCVKIYLPRYKQVEEEKSEKQEATTSPVREKTTSTVLVVEDDPGVRQIAVTLLSDMGYRVLEAENGLQALEIVGQDEEIDLLFTDMVMPGGLGGLELAKKVRAQYPEIKVIYTSGYTEIGPFNGQSGGEKIYWLTKPYTRAKLVAKVREALGES